MKTTLLCKVTPKHHHPILDRFLTIGQVESLKFSYEEFVCDLLGIKPNPDYPCAALDYQKNHMHYYLYADPVYLSLQRDTFFLEKKLTDDFTQDEIKNLCNALNTTFEDENRTFTISDQGQLFLELKKAPFIKTTSIAHIKRQPIDLFMPQGEEAMAWHAFMNEIQMFLFDHPLYQDRVRRGLLSPNSIWFSGGGQLPRSIENPFTTIFSNESFLKKVLSIDTQISSQTLDKFHQDNINNNTLIAFEDDNETDRILGVIWNNFKKRKIKNLDIYVSYQGKLLHIHNRFTQLLKLWKKTNTLENYFNAH
ncbi:MAG TPA: hypothetical protein DEP52_00240 [Methylophilaceae bacterium]|nr:hypothetical protein [Methylophilaceae bacterium]